MRNALVGTILLITASLAHADHRPALTWEGSVDGVAVLRIQGDRIDVDTRDGNVSQTNHRFITPLGAINDQIEVENRARGTARIRVLEQPRRNNNFTATVEKEFDEIAQGLKDWTKMLHSF